MARSACRRLQQALSKLVCSQDPANAGDRAEQLEVASQCLSDAFEIDDSTPPDFSLAEVYEAGINSLVRHPAPRQLLANRQSHVEQRFLLHS